MHAVRRRRKRQKEKKRPSRAQQSIRNLYTAWCINRTCQAIEEEEEKEAPQKATRMDSILSFILSNHLVGGGGGGEDGDERSSWYRSSSNNSTAPKNRASGSGRQAKEHYHHHQPTNRSQRIPASQREHACHTQWRISIFSSSSSLASPMRGRRRHRKVCRHRQIKVMRSSPELEVNGTAAASAAPFPHPSFALIGWCTPRKSSPPRLRRCRTESYRDQHISCCCCCCCQFRCQSKQKFRSTAPLARISSHRIECLWVSEWVWVCTAQNWKIKARPCQPFNSVLAPKREFVLRIWSERRIRTQLWTQQCKSTEQCKTQSGRRRMI